MLSFTITKPRQTLNQQWTFLVERGQGYKLDLFKKLSVGLLLTTALYLLFYFVTAVNDFIVFKGVAMFMIALAWCALLVLYPLIGLGQAKKKKQLKQFLDSISDAQLSYSVQIDEEKVVIVSNGLTHVRPWTEFTSFGIHQETLYVFNSVKAINSLYWNKTEMGSEAYSGLLELLNKKAISQAF